MIQVREQFGNIYIKILARQETFDYTLEKLLRIPDLTYNNYTNEWMAAKETIGELLLYFQNQIIWVTPLKDIVDQQLLHHELVQRHLQLEEQSKLDFFKSVTPYPYQVVGANFLAYHERAAILDGVGLGKTLQIVGACMLLFKEKKAKRALIVTLAPIVRQWRNEIERFTGHEAVAVYGTESQRKKKIEAFHKDKKSTFLVVNYEMLKMKKYADLLHKCKFDIIALDEAQKIKNGVDDKFLNLNSSELARGVYNFKYIPYRFVATATPVTGFPHEIYSLFYFLNDQVFGQWETFRDRYIRWGKWGMDTKKPLIETYQGELYGKIAPNFLRRTKEMREIQQQLPAVNHIHVPLEMTDKQSQAHDWLMGEIQNCREEIRNASGYQLLGGKMLNPEQVKEYYDAIVQGCIINLLTVCDSLQALGMGESKIAQRLLNEVHIKPDDYESPKIDSIVNFYEQMLDETVDGIPSKVVIFSKFERMVRLIHERLPHSVMYTGEMNSNAKEDAVQRFRNDPSVRAFVATDAASTGLNLQVANYMIHVDAPWDPTLIEQRNGRIDRTGSAFKNVTIYYYFMADSYEEQVWELLNRKADTSQSILTGQSGVASSDPTTKALDVMIKRREKKLKGQAV